MTVNTNIRFRDEEEGLFESIKKTAKANKRSMNAEILRAIEYYLKNAPEAHYEVENVKKQPVDKKVKT